MQSLNIYVINLEGSTDRLNAIAGRLATFGLTFERVQGFDGRKLDCSTAADYDPTRTRRFMGRALVGGDIGAYRSHLEVVRRFLSSGDRYALVLEDDALPLCNPVELLESAIPYLDALDPQWRLINVGPRRKPKVATLLSRHGVGDRNFDLMAAHHFPLRCHALVWSREGAQRFLEAHDRIFAPIDDYLRYWLCRAGHGYAFWPAPIETTEVESEFSRTGRRLWFYVMAKRCRVLLDLLVAGNRKWRFNLTRTWRKASGKSPNGVP